jgi:hypothetical protein
LGYPSERDIESKICLQKIIEDEDQME